LKKWMNWFHLRKKLREKDHLKVCNLIFFYLLFVAVCICLLCVWFIWFFYNFFIIFL
jgi:hypothetical protein